MAFKKRYFGNKIPITRSLIILIALLTSVKQSSGTNNLVMKNDTGANLSIGALDRELMQDNTKKGMKNEQNAEEVLITNENHIQVTVTITNIVNNELIKIEMKILKEENLNQTIRIIRLEKKIILNNNNNNKERSKKTDDSAPSDQLAATSSSMINIHKSSTNLPSSCNDLSTNGHNLNGIYLVYDRTAKKVTTAFCNFNNNKVTQQILGFVNVKSLPKGVHFYAQRTQTFQERSAVIPFDRVLMNEGGGLDGKTSGIFRAPKPGTYWFLFHGSKSNLYSAPLDINLRVNGVTLGNAYAHDYENAGMLSVGVHSVVKLKTGDEVILFKAGDGWLSDDNTPDTHYSGCLVEEELVI